MFLLAFVFFSNCYMCLSQKISQVMCTEVITWEISSLLRWNCGFVRKVLVNLGWLFSHLNLLKQFPDFQKNNTGKWSQLVLLIVGFLFSICTIWSPHFCILERGFGQKDGERSKQTKKTSDSILLLLGWFS